MNSSLGFLRRSVVGSCLPTLLIGLRLFPPTSGFYLSIAARSWKLLLGLLRANDELLKYTAGLGKQEEKPGELSLAPAPSLSLSPTPIGESKSAPATLESKDADKDKESKEQKKLKQDLDLLNESSAWFTELQRETARCISGVFEAELNSSVATVKKSGGKRDFDDEADEDSSKKDSKPEVKSEAKETKDAKESKEAKQPVAEVKAADSKAPAEAKGDSKAAAATGDAKSDKPAEAAKDEKKPDAVDKGRNEERWLRSNLLKVGLEAGGVGLDLSIGLPSPRTGIVRLTTSLPGPDESFDLDDLGTSSDEDDTAEEAQPSSGPGTPLRLESKLKDFKMHDSPSTPPPRLAGKRSSLLERTKQKLAQAEPLELSRRLTPGSRSAVITGDDARRFCQALIANEDAAAKFYSWMCTHLKAAVIGRQNDWLDKAARAAFAAILKHHGLLAEAISYARIIVRKDKMLTDSYRPAPELMDAFRQAQEVRTACMSTAQSYLENMERDAAYQKATERVIHAAEFLLRVSPSVDTVQSSGRHGVQGKSRRSHWKQIRTILRVVRYFRFLKVHAVMERMQTSALRRSNYQEIRSFLLDARVDISVLEDLMRQRGHAGLARLRGLRRVLKLLRALRSPTVRVEVLLAVRRTLLCRNILDGIDGAGLSIMEAIHREFTVVMQHAVKLLQDARGQPLLRLNALGVFVTRFRQHPADHKILGDVGILNALHELLKLPVESSTASAGSAPQQAAAEARSLRAACWRVFQLLATQIGMGVKTASGSGDLVTSTATPQLKEVLDILYTELHRALAAAEQARRSIAALPSTLR